MNQLLKVIKIFAVLTIGRALSISGSTCNPYIIQCSVDDNCWQYGSMHSIFNDDWSDYFKPKCNIATNNCVCDISGYNLYTCLPDVNGCSLCMSPPTHESQLDEYPALYPGYPAMYHCFNTINDYNEFTNEIRVVGVYESTLQTGRHISGAININLKTCSGQQMLEKPLILVLASYEPVEWSISSNDKYVIDNLQIHTIQALSYYEKNTTVSLNGNLESKQITNGITIENSYSSAFKGTGYGDDVGGGETALMLHNIASVFGDSVYSFIGQYKTNNIDLCVGNQGNLVKTNINDSFSVFTTNASSINYEFISEGCVPSITCHNHKNVSYRTVCNDDGTIIPITYSQPNCSTSAEYSYTLDTDLIDCYEECTDYIQFDMYYGFCDINKDNYYPSEWLPYGCLPRTEVFGNNNSSVRTTCNSESVTYQMYVGKLHCQGDPDAQFTLYNNICNNFSFNFGGFTINETIYLELQYCPSTGNIISPTQQTTNPSDYPTATQLASESLENKVDILSKMTYFTYILLICQIYAFGLIKCF